MRRLDNYIESNANKNTNTFVYFIKNTFTNVFTNTFLKKLKKIPQGLI